MKVDLIHKPNCDNIVLNALGRREEFQAMKTIQTLWLMFTSKENLWCKIRKGYINYHKAHRHLSEFLRDKVFKEVKLVEGLLKYKQS